MVKVYAARTLPVNPPDAPLVLKRYLLWEALQRKIRHATEFVPAMRQCTVVSDEKDVVLRDCVLEHQNGELRNMREEVTSYGKQWIIFRQSEGSVTTNIVSNGPDNTDQDLQLTYTFEWNYPDVEEGTAAHDKAIETTNMMALVGVKQSIITARKMVQEGVIKDAS